MTTYTPEDFETTSVYTKQYTCNGSGSTYVKNDWTRPEYVCAPKTTKQEIFDSKHRHLTKKQKYAKLMKHNGVFRSSLYCFITES